MDKNKGKDQFCGTRLPPELYDKVAEHAGIFGRSISKEIMVLVRDGIAAREKEQFLFSKPKKKKEE